MVEVRKFGESLRAWVMPVAAAMMAAIAGCSDADAKKGSETGVAGKAPVAQQATATNVAQKAQEQKKPEAAVPAKPRPPARKLTTILVRVNGEDITWGDLVRYTDMMAVMMKNRRKDCTPEDVRRFKAKFMQRFSMDLMRQKVMMTSLAPSNIVVSAAVRAQVEREFTRNFAKKGQKFEELRTDLKNVGYLRDINRALYSEMVIKQFLTTTCSNQYFVSDQELKDVRRGMELRNRVAVETNKLQVARAQMVLDRIRKGEDFAKMANEFSQDDERGNDPDEAKKDAAGEKKADEEDVALNGGDQGDCDESDFVNDKHVWQKLLRMKPGDVSELFEIEEGYAIYKVLEIKKAEESNTGDKSLHLARIFFRRAFEFPEQTDDELRVDVEREKRGDLTTAVYRTFLKMSKIEYPDGHIQLR